LMRWRWMGVVEGEICEILTQRVDGRLVWLRRIGLRWWQSVWSWWWGGVVARGRVGAILVLSVPRRPGCALRGRKWG